MVALRSWLARFGAGIVLALSASEPVDRPIVHDGIEIRSQVPAWYDHVERADPLDARLASGWIAREIDRYPEGFLSQVCGVESVVLTGVDERYGLAGNYFHDERSIRIRAFDRSLPRAEELTRVVFVHEADHACNLSNRTLEDIEAWDLIVDALDPSYVASVVENPVLSRPEGFARWYGAITMLSEDPMRRHLEDEATIKELITYGWDMIESRDDPILDAKVDALIDRYERWSGGVMNRERFLAWSSDEARGDKSEPLYEHADDR